MNASQIYIAVLIVILAIIAGVVFLVNRNKKENALSPLAGVAFGFVLAVLMFGEPRWLSYSLLGIGVVLGVVDIVRKLRRG